ncbi:MAG: PAS domain S-box protein [Syntrophales bacterium]|nr:PAS domain S-box protein [Syntrophales bacterium]
MDSHSSSLEKYTSLSLSQATALKICVVYGILGALWILLSDRIVESSGLDMRVITWLQTVKGWLFVLVTMLLLFFLINRYVSVIDESHKKRMESEKELRESEERYRLIAENTSDVIWLVDAASGRYTYVSPSVKRLRGFTAEEIVGKTMEEVLTPELYRRVSETLPHRIAKFEAGDESVRTNTIEVDQFCKDGSPVTAEVVTTLIADEGGEVTVILGVSRDITERKQAEEERAKLQNQLLQSQKMESVGRLAGGVAHDFNNMLGVILGHTEIAMEQVDPDQPLSANLQEIRKAAERSAELTGQLLAFARKQTIDPKVLDLNETVEGMLRMLRRLIGEDIHLAWLPGADPWLVKIDPSQIDQILANLCINARDAIGGVGKVTIETGNVIFDKSYCIDHAGFVPGEFILLAVSDNGCGMDREVLGQLFEPFFTTKDVGKGTGLGLATVYGIVKQNNGFINVYSEPGQGTTFKIYLPSIEDQAVRVKIQEAQEPFARGHETVLVVEDELAILDLSKLMLEREGYRVLVAGTPGEALRLAEKYSGEIHLLMTDVVMPGMNGRDMADRMLSLYPNLKCLFTSGYTANVIAHHGVLDDGVYFIQKPFSRRDLIVKVRSVLDRG